MNAIFVGFLSGALPLVLETGRNVEFEYATLCAWVASILCLFLNDKNYFLATLKVTLTALITMSLCLLASPKICGLSSSYTWFFIQVLPAILIFLSIRNYISQSPLKRSAIILSLMLFSIYIFMWSSPQKRWVSLWFGYLHGPVYDDFIPLTFGIVAARLSHAMFGMYLTYRHRSLGLLSLIVWGISLYDPINSHGRHALDSYLSDSLSSEGLTLHYKRDRISSSESLLREASFHRAQLIKILGITDIPKIDIYVYANTDEKKVYFGGAETDITDVFTPSVHIVASSSPHSTLRHELVHALLSNQNSLGFHWNMLITEGIAVALAPTDSPISLDEQARYLIEKGELPNLTDVFGPLFWLKSANVSYGIAGSFIHWLLLEKEPAQFLKVYGGSSFEESYLTSIESLYQKWISYIKAIPYDPLRVNSLISRLMDAPSVFFDVCPHAKIDRMAESPLSLLDSKDSTDYLKWLSKVHPESRMLRSDELSKLRKAGVLPAATNERADLSTIAAFENQLLEADLLVLNDMNPGASKLLDQLSNSHINPGRSLRRSVELRQYALDELSGSDIKTTFQFIMGNISKSSLDNSAIRYLKRKNGFSQNTLELFNLKYAELNREVLRLNYLLLEKNLRYEEAKKYLKVLITNEPSSAYLGLEFDRIDEYSKLYSNPILP